MKMNNPETTVYLPYCRFIDLQKQIYDVEAIDYFLAKQFTELLISRLVKTQTTVENKTDKQCCDVLFHLLLALSVSLRQGHSCLPINKIAQQRLGYHCDNTGVVSHQGFQFPELAYLNELLVGLNIGEQQEQGIVFHHNNLYLRRYFLFEQQIIAFLAQHQSLSDQEHLPQSTDIIACLDLLFPDENNEPANQIDWQKVAVANALNKSFSIIAGGPGTGKTYTVTKLLAAIILLKTPQSLNISLVAPTGKAAQRLSESINQAKAGFSALLPEHVLASIPTETKTIHRLLGVIPNSPNFRHHQDNLLNIDVLLIDEVSMVDLPLMARIFRALPKHCQVILLGDAQQLPSVAAGSVLSDLTPNKQAQFSASNRQYLEKVTGIANLPVSKRYPADHLTYLTHSRRFDGKGGIGVLAQLVISGDSEQSWQLLQAAKKGSQSQLMFVDECNFSTLKDNWFNDMVEQYYRPLSQATSIEQAFHLLSTFRFLAATRQGDTGVETINLLIESTLFPSLFSFSSVSRSNTRHYVKPQNTLYHAKPIMINENDYSLGLYNGDIGMIWKNEKGHLMAYFEQQNGQYKQILPSRLPQFETVYAMTIHKTQGSEFEHVALLLPTNTDNQLLTRELLYTGITRAKAKITIQSNKAVWYQGVESQVSRYSGIQLHVNN
ncbi:exodeoxyribonuclease V subunit alpha [Thalassotalea sp. SU-HH00458]|uniref:exodeoxyribonuclease V subunit alpha n=1 Tax=Thalassotalea sp. SU-HH00458 TaxID=3127657 RepID=UPI00310959F4